MTLPASGAITWTQICNEFGLAANTAIWPANFYGLGGAPASGTLGFADFYGRSAPPVFPITKVGTTTLQGGIAALTVAWPSGHAADDVAILLVGSNNQTIATPSGWTLIAAGTGVGTAGGVGGTRVALFWKRATGGSEASASVADAGTVNVAQMVVFRGCLTGATPIEALGARSFNATSAASQSIANANSTLGANRLVIMALATNKDSATAGITSFTNANLANITEHVDGGNASSNGQSLGLASGERAAAGAIGSTTVALSTSAGFEGYSFALIPASGGGGGVTFTPTSGTYSEDDGGTGTVTFTITASSSVAWTWSRSGDVATSNVASGASATSITFTMVASTVDKFTTFTVSAGGSNWTINLSTAANNN